MKRVIAVCFVVLVAPGAAMANVQCDMDAVRLDNQAADQAYQRKANDARYEEAFRTMMNRVLGHYRQGCFLPPEDPDSVLFRATSRSR